MPRSKTSEYVNQAKLAQEFNLDPTLAKYMIYFSAINGLEKSGAMVVKVVNGRRATLVHRERFRRWLQTINCTQMN